MCDEMSELFGSQASIIVSICFLEALLPAFKSRIYMFVVTHMLHELLQSKCAILIDIK